MIKSRSIIPRIKNVSDKIIKKVKTRNLYSVTFFNRAVYALMWKSILGPDRPQMAIWRMRIACWTHDYKHDTLTAVEVQQMSHERAPVLHIRTFPVLFTH
jgi:hypothetical protein